MYFIILYMFCSYYFRLHFYLTGLHCITLYKYVLIYIYIYINKREKITSTHNVHVEQAFGEACIYINVMFTMR